MLMKNIPPKAFLRKHNSDLQLIHRKTKIQDFSFLSDFPLLVSQILNAITCAVCFNISPKLGSHGRALQPVTRLQCDKLSWMEALS